MSRFEKITATLFTAFVLVQLTASLNRVSLYPFSPYRMFSKIWPDGVIMDHVRFIDRSGHSYKTWELIKLPFFQANSLSFSVFLDPSTPSRRQALCSVLLESAGTDRVEVRGEEIEFRAETSGAMKPKTLRSEVRHVCQTQR